jgi:peroxiredoxin
MPLLPALALACAVAGCGGGARPADTRTAWEREQRQIRVGETMPSFRMERLDARGTFVTIPSAKVMLVAFLATWSEPDKKSIPELEKIWKRHRGHGLVVVYVSIDDEETKHGVLEFAKNYGATFPVVWDDGHAIASKLRLENEPSFVVVDARGVVRAVYGGYHDGKADDFDREIAALLGD